MSDNEPLVPRLRALANDHDALINTDPADLDRLLTEAADKIEELTRIMTAAGEGWRAALERIDRLESAHLRCTCIDVRGVIDRQAVLIPGDELCPIHARGMV